MYVMPNGEEILVIDGHTHLWDGSPANHKNIHGKEFIDCFYDYHRNLSPADYLWPKEKFEKYPLETLVQDLFVDGYDDMAILQLTDKWAIRYLDKCQALGVKNIHLHKGPTILPLNMDAFDVHDVDDAATSFPALNFIVEHVGLPRLDDFCWIATQERNVYAGLAVAMPFIHPRPRYFAEIMSN